MHTQISSMEEHSRESTNTSPREKNEQQKELFDLFGAFERMLQAHEGFDLDPRFRVLLGRYSLDEVFFIIQNVNRRECE